MEYIQTRCRTSEQVPVGHRAGKISSHERLIQVIKNNHTCNETWQWPLKLEVNNKGSEVVNVREGV